MSLDVSRPITRREYVIDYVSPLICDEISAQSGDVEINILPFDELGYPTGLLVTGVSEFTLTWNPVIAAICYNVYRALAEGGPYTLISSCQQDREYVDDPGPGSWFYRVSAITHEGEGPLSPPETTAGDPPVAGCPAETGTETPCDLLTEDNTVLGTLTPNPFIATHSESFGTFDGARYKITYTAGAYKEDDNPNPGDFKFNGYKYFYNSGASSHDPDGGFPSFFPTQAEVEADVPVGKEHEFTQNASGPILIEKTRIGSATNPVAGSPNPTFELKRTGIFPVEPLRVRVQGYNSASFVGACVIDSSATPEWNGSLPIAAINLPNVVTYLGGNGEGFQGFEILEVRCGYYGSHPTNGTGCGWFFYISLVDGAGSVQVWRGIKGVGTTPVGRYYRESGCLTSPACIVIESY